jgi:hypothetical protein
MMEQSQWMTATQGMMRNKSLLTGWYPQDELLRKVMVGFVAKDLSTIASS